MHTAKSDRGVGAAEEPKRAASQAVPQPYRADGEVQYIKMPEFPVGDSLKEFLYSHFGPQK